jgi:hypothetical protein
MRSSLMSYKSLYSSGASLSRLVTAYIGTPMWILRTVHLTARLVCNFTTSLFVAVVIFMVIRPDLLIWEPLILLGLISLLALIAKNEAGERLATAEEFLNPERSGFLVGSFREVVERICHDLERITTEVHNGPVSGDIPAYVLKVGEYHRQINLRDHAAYCLKKITGLTPGEEVG